MPFPRHINMRTLNTGRMRLRAVIPKEELEREEVRPKIGSAYDPETTWGFTSSQ